MSNYKFFEEHNHQATQNIKKSYTDIISDIGEDVTREGIVKTPERASKAMQFLTHGYDLDADEILNQAIFHEEYSEMGAAAGLVRKPYWLHCSRSWQARCRGDQDAGGCQNRASRGRSADYLFPRDTRGPQRIRAL